MNERNKKIDLNSAKLDEEKKNSLRPLSLTNLLANNLLNQT